MEIVVLTILSIILVFSFVVILFLGVLSEYLDKEHNKFIRYKKTKGQYYFENEDWIKHEMEVYYEHD